MSFKYKVNCIELLKKKGILQAEHFGGQDLHKIRKGEVVGIKTLEKLCDLLDLQPGEIIEYIKKEKHVD